MTERTIMQRTEVRFPVDRDAMYLYYIRYTEMRDEDGFSETRAYYGGIGGVWHQFEIGHVLDMTVDGVLMLDGLDVIQVEMALATEGAISGDHHDRMWKLHVQLTSFFSGEKDDAGLTGRET